MSAQREAKMDSPMMDQPGLGINASGLEPLGHAVLVRTYEPQTKSSIIALPDDVRGRMQQLEQRCVVVALGPECWKDEGVPRAKPGDRVLVTKFAGYIAGGDTTADGQNYRLVNDRDIFAKINWSQQS
jgi:co-chaperonin GroES (HSP10)